MEDIPSSNSPVKVECEPRQYKALAAGADHSVALTGMFEQGQTTLFLSQVCNKGRLSLSQVFNKGRLLWLSQRALTKADYSVSFTGM